jgi:ADYC domain
LTERKTPGLAILAALTVAAAPLRAMPDEIKTVEVKGTAFQIILKNGHTVEQDQLPGTILMIGDGSGRQRRIRIDGVEQDSKDPAGEIVLYALSEQDPGSGEWHNLCQRDVEGRQLGFPLEGAFMPDGHYEAVPGKILFTCTGGAEGKCIRFGYKPWGRGPNNISLAPYYQTCVRLIRADYCGDGTGHTRNGTPIDIFDRIGIQGDETAPGMSFEAAWGPSGAVCVRHTRLPNVLGMEALVAQCPHIANATGETCDESAHALLFNRSFGR